MVNSTNLVWIWYLYCIIYMNNDCIKYISIYKLYKAIRMRNTHVFLGKTVLGVNNSRINYI